MELHVLCQNYFSLIECDVESASSYVEVLKRVIKASQECKAKTFLLVEMGKLDSAKLKDFLSCLRYALQKYTYIVIASSSGSGWKAAITSKTKEASDAFELWTTLTCKLKRVESRNFNSEEASLFMSILEIDRKWREKVSIVSGRNPLLLSCFELCSDDDDYYTGCEMMEMVVNRQIIDLLEMKGDVALESKLFECEKWLMYAQYSIAICNDDRLNFKLSCVGLKHLAYVSSANSETFTLALGFPSSYKYFRRYIKQCFEEKKEAYLKSPTVQGLYFEEEVLHSLEQLHINVVNHIGASKCLKFMFQAATHQLDDILTTMDCITYILDMV